MKVYRSSILKQQVSELTTATYTKWFSICNKINNFCQRIEITMEQIPQWIRIKEISVIKYDLKLCDSFIFFNYFPEKMSVKFHLKLCDSSIFCWIIFRKKFQFWKFLKWQFISERKLIKCRKRAKPYNFKIKYWFVSPCRQRNGFFIYAHCGLHILYIF
jgi:hypothetical protein